MAQDAMEPRPPAAAADAGGRVVWSERSGRRAVFTAAGGRVCAGDPIALLDPATQSGQTGS